MRTLLTAVGIGLGVAVLYASIATSVGIDRSVDRTVRDIVGSADLRVSAFLERGLSAETVRLITATPGVSVGVPAIERQAYLRRDVDVVGDLPPPVTVLGIDPIVDPDVHPLRVVDGSALTRRDEAAAVISEQLAVQDGYGVGSDLLVQRAGEPERFRVVGIVEGDGPVAGAAGRTVILPIDAVRRLFEVETVDRIDVRIAEGFAIQTVEDELVARLTTEPYVLAAPGDLADSLRSSTAEFQATTALIAAVALFAGAFLIFNTLSMTVGERLREVGLLRAAGATRRQVARFVLAGAAFLGAIGSLLGLIGGAVVTAGLAGYVGSIASFPVDPLGAPPMAVVVALAVGMLVTIAAALEPAWRASRIPPVEALRLRADPASIQQARLRWLVVVFAVIAVLGLAAWPRGAGEAGVVRAVAIYGLLLAVTLLTPFLLPLLSRAAGAPFAAVVRFEERLARGSLVRDRSRTALTLGALTIGLAMIVAIGGVALNSRRAASAWLETVVPGDELLTAIRPVGPDEDVPATLAAVDGVLRVSPIATFDLAWQGRRIDAAAVVGADLLADGRLRFIDGDRTVALTALDAGGSAVLPRSQADRLGLGPGDTMDILLGGGRAARLTVAGIVDRTLPGRGGEAVLVGWRDATDSFGVAGADVFAVRFGPGRAASARPGLEAAGRQLALEPRTLDHVQGAVSEALGRVFGLFDVLALVAVLVAALGIVNTLTMNVVERVREIGVLRAAGMTRRQVGRMVVVEAGILGLMGAILGALTGLAAGVLLVLLGGGRLDASMEPPWAVLVLGVAVSMAAAWYPARVAGRWSIVRAVQFE